MDSQINTTSSETQQILKDLLAKPDLSERERAALGALIPSDTDDVSEEIPCPETSSPCAPSEGFENKDGGFVDSGTSCCAGDAPKPEASSNKSVETFVSHVDQALAHKERELDKKGEAARRVVRKYAKRTGIIAGILPFGGDSLAAGIMGLKMFGAIAAVYGISLSKNQKKRAWLDSIQLFWSVLSISGFTTALYVVIKVVLKHSPAYLIGATLDGLLTYFAFATIGDAFSYYCRNNLFDQESSMAKRVLAEYMRRNWRENFWDRLPDAARRELEKHGITSNQMDDSDIMASCA